MLDDQGGEDEGWLDYHHMGPDYFTSMLDDQDGEDEDWLDYHHIGPDYFMLVY